MLLGTKYFNGPRHSFHILSLIADCSTIQPDSANSRPMYPRYPKVTWNCSHSARLHLNESACKIPELTIPPIFTDLAQCPPLILISEQGLVWLLSPSINTISQLATSVSMNC